MEYHSSVNIGGDPKSGLEIKKFIMDMPSLRGGGLVILHTKTDKTD